jgi:GTP-binding protein LepA
MDFTPGAYAAARVLRVDMLLNGKPVDALCFVAHADAAEAEGRRVAAKLKALIDRQQFEVVVQAAIAGKVFARERIPPFRKNVLEKNGKVMGGGDVSRKNKLLDAQRAGKKRMRTVGNVELSAEAFRALIADK